MNEYKEFVRAERQAEQLFRDSLTALRHGDCNTARQMVASYERALRYRETAREALADRRHPLSAFALVFDGLVSLGVVWAGVWLFVKAPVAMVRSVADLPDGVALLAASQGGFLLGTVFGSCGLWAIAQGLGILLGFCSNFVPWTWGRRWRGVLRRHARSRGRGFLRASREKDFDRGVGI